MIDIKIIRENRDIVKENIKKKFQDDKLSLVDEVYEYDVEYRDCKAKGDNLRSEKNKLSAQIGALMRDKKVEFMIVVPAFLKLLKAGIESELKNAPKITQVLFKFMYHLAKFIPSYKVKKFLNFSYKSSPTTSSSTISPFSSKLPNLSKFSDFAHQP